MSDMLNRLFSFCSRLGNNAWRSGFVLLLASAIWTHPAAADDTLDADIDQLKADVATLSQTLFELEESILYPPDTQFAVYLSLADADAFVLDSVELAVNGRPAVSHLYTDQEREALEQGGLQRLYLGNLATGEHSLSATFNGQAANDRYVRREATFRVHKGSSEAQVQLVLEARAPDFRPVFTLKEWQ